MRFLISDTTEADQLHDFRGIGVPFRLEIPKMPKVSIIHFQSWPPHDIAYYFSKQKNVHLLKKWLNSYHSFSTLFICTTKAENKNTQAKQQLSVSTYSNLHKSKQNIYHPTKQTIYQHTLLHHYADPLPSTALFLFKVHRDNSCCYTVKTSIMGRLGMYFHLILIKKKNKAKHFDRLYLKKNKNFFDTQFMVTWV